MKTVLFSILFSTCNRSSKQLHAAYTKYLHVTLCTIASTPQDTLKIHFRCTVKEYPIKEYEYFTVKNTVKPFYVNKTRGHSKRSFWDNFKVQFIFSKVVPENLVTSSDIYRVCRSVATFPIGGLGPQGQYAIQMQENSV